MEYNNKYLGREYDDLISDEDLDIEHDPDALFAVAMTFAEKNNLEKTLEYFEKAKSRGLAEAGIQKSEEVIRRLASNEKGNEGSLNDETLLAQVDILELKSRISDGDFYAALEYFRRAKEADDEKSGIENLEKALEKYKASGEFNIPESDLGKAEYIIGEYYERNVYYKGVALKDDNFLKSIKYYTNAYEHGNAEAANDLITKIYISLKTNIRQTIETISKDGSVVADFWLGLDYMFGIVAASEKLIGQHYLQKAANQDTDKKLATYARIFLDYEKLIIDNQYDLITSDEMDMIVSDAFIKRFIPAVALLDAMLFTREKCDILTKNFNIDYFMKHKNCVIRKAVANKLLDRIYDTCRLICNDQDGIYLTENIAMLKWIMNKMFVHFSPDSDEYEVMLRSKDLLLGTDES